MAPPLYGDFDIKNKNVATAFLLSLFHRAELLGITAEIILLFSPPSKTVS
jgi:hypothetical protein